MIDDVIHRSPISVSEAEQTKSGLRDRQEGKEAGFSNRTQCFYRAL